MEAPVRAHALVATIHRRGYADRARHHTRVQYHGVAASRSRARRPDSERRQPANDRIHSDHFALGETWFTDCQDASLCGGNSDYEDYQSLNSRWQGAATIARWREAILADWQQRFRWFEE